MQVIAQERLVKTPEITDGRNVITGENGLDLIEILARKIFDGADLCTGRHRGGEGLLHLKFHLKLFTFFQKKSFLYRGGRGFLRSSGPVNCHIDMSQLSQTLRLAVLNRDGG